MTQTRREYAISLGLAKAGRGRMSREANEAIAMAEAKGTKFTDTQYYSVIKPRKDGTLPKPEKKVKEVVVDSQYTGGTQTYIRDAKNTILVGKVGEHSVSCNAIQICRNSGVSISGCGGCNVSGHRVMTARWTSGPKRGRIVLTDAIVRLPKE